MPKRLKTINQNKSNINETIKSLFTKQLVCTFLKHITKGVSFLRNVCKYIASMHGGTTRDGHETFPPLPLTK